MGKQDKYTSTASASVDAVEAVDGVVSGAEVVTTENTGVTANTAVEATTEATSGAIVTDAAEHAEAETQHDADIEPAAKLEQEIEESTESVLPESEVTVSGLGNFKGVTVGAGSFVGAYAKKLLDAVHTGELDYVIVASSRVNGVERAVLVSPALFAQINGHERFNALSKSISWATSAPTFSSDAMFAGRTAIAVGEFGVTRAVAAAALLQDQTKLFGYIVGAADFHDSFAA